MPHDVPVRVDLLRGRHEIRLRIREPTGLEMVDRELDGERFAFRDGVKVWGEYELGRGHVVCTREDANRGGVTRPTYTTVPRRSNQVSHGYE